jgi:hypothetical protein
MGKKVDMVIKAFPSHIKSVNSEKFTAEVVMSDETKDRYGEVIRADAYKKTIKNFMKHPILLSSHLSWGSLRNQIGVWEKVWVQDNQLVGRAKYFTNMGNPEADWAWKLVELGVAAYSVGFISKAYEDTEKDKLQKNPSLPWRVFTEVELLETSQVLLPANPNALQKAGVSEDVLMRTMAHDVSDAMSVEDMKQFIGTDLDEKFLVDMEVVLRELIEQEAKEADDIEQIEIQVPDSIKTEEGVTHEDNPEKLAIDTTPVGEQRGEGETGSKSEESEQLTDNTEESVRKEVAGEERVIVFEDLVKEISDRIEETIGKRIDKLTKLLVGEDLSTDETDELDILSLADFPEGDSTYIESILGTEKDSALLAEIKQTLEGSTKALDTKKMVDG